MATISFQRMSGRTEHDCVPKILTWKYELVNGNVKETPDLYGCTKCDATFTELPKKEEIPSEHSSHTEYVENCFGCKVETLQLNAGDAKSSIIESGTTQKKWDKELDAYRSARKQGIQPKSTKMKDIKEAVDVSNKVGKAYDASSPTGGLL